MMADAIICYAVRTPTGRYKGTRAHVRTDDLAAVPPRALADRNPSIDPFAIEDVAPGRANHAGENNRNVAPMVALLAGLPVSRPGDAGSRLCASGLDAIAPAAARAIWIRHSHDFGTNGARPLLDRAELLARNDHVIGTVKGEGERQ